MRTLAIGVVLLCLLLPAALAAQTSDVDWVRGTDFSGFHTFTWATGAYPIQDPDANLSMANAVLDQLQSKGVQYVEPQQKFDLFVTYNAKLSPDPQDSSRRLITLAVRIFDSRNNNVIWRAGGSVALGSDNDANRSKVRDLLATMFEKYPPQ
jgi:hypothetical protein